MTFIDSTIATSTLKPNSRSSIHPWIQASNRVEMEGNPKSATLAFSSANKSLHLIACEVNRSVATPARSITPPNSPVKHLPLNFL